LSKQFIFKTIEDEKYETWKNNLLIRCYDMLNYRNVMTFCYNTTIGWYAGFAPYTFRNSLIDLGSTIELLAVIQAYSIFHHGEFNGDAHPGSVLYH
jgi:hypothetical protein